MISSNHDATYHITELVNYEFTSSLFLPKPNTQGNFNYPSLSHPKEFSLRFISRACPLGMFSSESSLGYALFPRNVVISSPRAAIQDFRGRVIFPPKGMCFLLPLYVLKIRSVTRRCCLSRSDTVLRPCIIA